MLITFWMQSLSLLIQESSFQIQKVHHFLYIQIIIFNANFIMFDTKIIIFNTHRRLSHPRPPSEIHHFDHKITLTTKSFGPQSSSFLMQLSSFSIQNSSFLTRNTFSASANATAKFIILNSSFSMQNSSFLIHNSSFLCDFDTQFLAYNKKFIVFTHHTRASSQRRKSRPARKSEKSEKSRKTTRTNVCETHKTRNCVSHCVLKMMNFAGHGWSAGSFFLM